MSVLNDKRKLTHLFVCMLVVMAGLASHPMQASEAARSEIVDWNQWRGPGRNGTVAGDLWPADFSGLESEWRVDLGKGYSGPLVVGDRVFVD